MSRSRTAPTTALAAGLRGAHLEGGRRHLSASQRVAVIASFAETAVVSRSLSALVAEFERRGYDVVVVRASDDRSPLVWPDASVDPIVIRKDNVGYDFGSWAVGLAMFPAIRRREYVILANDSLAGPFASMDVLFDSFESATSDVWAATSTRQIREHIQSFFFGFRGRVLSDPAMWQFWKRLPIETDKATIIERYEFGLSQMLGAEGFTTSAAFESERIVSPTENPTVDGWRDLLRLGFPFVKRELLTNPAVAPKGEDVPRVVADLYGIDPNEWI